MTIFWTQYKKRKTIINAFLFYVYLFDNSPKTLNRLLVILAFNRFDIAFAVTGHDGLDSGSDA